MTAPVPVDGIDAPEIADALERNQWEFIRGFAAVGGVEVVDDAHSLRVATGVPSPLFNPVLRATALQPGPAPHRLRRRRAGAGRRGARVVSAPAAAVVLVRRSGDGAR